jgi:DNA-binding LacI/PurR family transcriptional regulator
MYDTFHANIEEKSVPDAIKACADLLQHVHISENDRSTPGQGAVRWTETFDTLKEISYDGWLMIEAFGLALPELVAATKIWRRMYESEEQLASPQARFFHEKEIEGVLLVGPIPEQQVRKFISAHPVPIICVDNAPEMENMTCVTSSNFYGAMHATDYLISRGHKRIAYITANREQLYVDERLMGFRASMYKHHLENEIAFIKEMDFSQDTFEGGYEFAKELICSGMIEKASVILTTNDNVSAGLLKGLVDRGVKVPEDVSIMGFGNDPMGLACQPALTTMEVQSYRMGKIAMEILLDLVVMGKSPGELIMLPMRVIERDSVKDC